MKRKLTMMLLCIMGWVVALAQTAISGKVVSAQDGEPIIGAAVKVKGASQGVVTNLEGQFSINAKAGATLVFSYVGMQTKEAAAKNGMKVELSSDDQLLDEVMVVAYGTTTKKSFTGSASSLRPGDMSLEKASLVKSLNGKMAGVTVGGATGDPGADQRIQIRGIGSINGSTQPLYVVDGIPVLSERGEITSGLKSQSILATLNPDDIESMTVLKDAAAASLYGSRAANGVIIITTKKGKAGATKVTYDGEFGWSNIAVQGALKMMNSQQLKNYMKAALQGYFVFLAGFSEEDAWAAAEEEINVPWEQGGWLHDPTCATSTDWSKEVYRNGFQTNHQVGISGGNEKTQFFASFGYNKANGTVKASEFERYSGRLNVDHKINNWLKVGLKQMISFTNTEGFRDQNDQAQGFGTSAPLSIMHSSDPTAPVKNADGSYNEDVAFGQGTNPNLMWQGKLNEWTEFDKSKTMRSLTNADIEVKLPYNFILRSIFGYDYISNAEHEFWAPESVNGSSVQGLSARYDFSNHTLTSSSTLNWAQDFGLHSIQALGGFELEDKSIEDMYAASKKLPSYKLPQLSNGVPEDCGGSISESSMMSWLANANYNYDNKYYLSASFRRDGSSRLAAENRWANFWSVSGAWRISGESFLKDNPLFSDLKVRLSYGTNGNLPTGYFDYMGRYSTFYGYGTNGAYYWSVLSNPNLGWEKSKNLNIGIDWQLFNRVNLTVEYYNKVTTDMLFDVPTSFVTGFSSKTSNLGKLVNKGFEFTVSSQNLTGALTWNTDFNFTVQSTKVDELPEGNDVQYGDGNMYLLREGESLHTFYLPEFVGVDPETGLGEFWIDPSDHEKGKTNYYSKAGKTIVGKALPDFQGGITNRFAYKGFDLSFMISFQGGGSMFDYPGYFLKYSDGMRVGSFNMDAEVDGNYWTKPGDIVDYPRPIYGNPFRSDRFSSRTIRSTDNIRMRDITFGYKVPIKKSVIENLRVYFRASNPFMIYSATKNIDPDVDINGYRQTDTPPTRSFVFGLNFEL